MDDTIKTYLDKLKKDGKHDQKFTDLLIASYDEKEEGLVTANKIIFAIEEQYAQDQGNKS